MLVLRLILLAVTAAFFEEPIIAQQSTLTIISPHRKSVQQEFIPLFIAHYKEKFGKDIKVDWLDQGGASDDLKFILSRFDKTPQTIGVDIFWGGGEQPHYDLDSKNLLLPFKLPTGLMEQVPESVGHVNLFSPKQTWYASALSSFGIFYNKKASHLLKIPHPTDWQDLAQPVFYNNVSMADPRRSSGSITMIQIILKAYGWEEGWKLLTRMAANTKRFVHSSTDPIKSVVTGETTTGLTVDYFAQAKIMDLGLTNLGYVMPASHTILNSDPISILKGAPHLEAAKEFVAFILSSKAQKLLILPKGSKEGPKFSVLGRMAVNKLAYEGLSQQDRFVPNPFEMNLPSFSFDMAEATKVQNVIMDLYSAHMIDNHILMKKAWKALTKRKKGASALLSEADLARFTAPPLSEEAFLSLVPRWQDQTFRNGTVNDWSAQSKAKYLSFLPQNNQQGGSR